MFKNYLGNFVFAGAILALAFGFMKSDYTFIGPQEEMYAGESPEDPSLSLRNGNKYQTRLKIGQRNSPEYFLFRQKLDSLYDVKQRYHWSGAVMVAYQGQPIYTRYMGYADRVKRTPINPNTSFQLASTSKPFTAVAILQLQENGKLNIYDDVRKYIPEFPYTGINIKMLLTHRSGMQDYIHFANSYWSTNRDGYMSNEDLIKLMASKKPALSFSPNTRFRYTNTNYALLASIVERVSQESFADYLKMNIFIPLRMNHTQVIDPRKPMPEFASKCYKGGSEYKFMYQDGLYGDKGVFSTVQDMLKFDKALYTTGLLKRNSLYAAFTPHNKDMRSPRNYGLGWRMYLYPSGEKIVYHNGLWHGNNSCFYRFIQNKFTVIVQCNKFTKATYDHPSQICDLLAEVEGIDNSLVRN